MLKRQISTGVFQPVFLLNRFLSFKATLLKVPFGLLKKNKYVNSERPDSFF